MDQGFQVYEYLKKIGCCNKCSLRFLGEKDAAAFRDVESSLNKRGFIELDNEKVKMSKSNPCTGCLGLLQPPYCDTILSKALEEAKKIEYDSKTFYLALTTPVAHLLRAQSLWVDLKTRFPEFIKQAFPHDLITIGVKETWKYSYLDQLEKALGKKYTLMSDLRITLSVTYEDEAKECECLFKMYPDQFSKSRNKKYLGSIENFSRKSTENVLKDTEDKILSENFPIPPDIPSNQVNFSQLSTFHNSIYVAGRYNKWSRVLPQTPWILAGERKMESSVQELICDPISKLTNAQEYRFSSSGREDVDVRNLGRGRPFYVELCDPKKSQISNDEMRTLEDEINLKAYGKVSIRDLQSINKDSISKVKIGEEEKTKVYSALCVRPDGKAIENLGVLDDLKDVEIQQSTPLRVLHRRPVAVRTKIVHWMKASAVKDPSKFIIKMNTQAGTYVKEFIHGDFGRTKPSLGDLLGNVELDILTLDVEEITLDWPPELDYSKSSDIK